MANFKSFFSFFLFDSSALFLFQTMSCFSIFLCLKSIYLRERERAEELRRGRGTGEESSSRLLAVEPHRRARFQDP